MLPPHVGGGAGDGGPATAAGLVPTDVAVGPGGEVYVTDGYLVPPNTRFKSSQVAPFRARVPGRVDLRAFVSCASSFSVGGYVRLHMLAGGILLRLRLGYALGQTRGRWFWFPLTAENALKKTHLDTPISPERGWVL